jgi:hypothetical protein
MRTTQGAFQMPSAAQHKAPEGRRTGAVKRQTVRVHRRSRVDAIQPGTRGAYSMRMRMIRQMSCHDRAHDECSHRVDGITTPVTEWVATATAGRSE